MANNDIYSIVQRLAVLEGRITPVAARHGLNPQQKSVPQMPALFRPRTQKILGGDPDAKNPMSGYAVGGCEESAMQEEILGKKSLRDYLQTVQAHKDNEILAKRPNAHGLETRVVTIEMADGRTCEIHGNDQDGYEVRHAGRSLPTKFPHMDHARMAVDMYNHRSATANKQTEQHSDADYIEEK